VQTLPRPNLDMTSPGHFLNNDAPPHRRKPTGI
jgi:hypothetical protein